MTPVYSITFAFAVVQELRNGTGNNFVPGSFTDAASVVHGHLQCWWRWLKIFQTIFIFQTNIQHILKNIC